MRRCTLLLILASGATCRPAQPVEDPFEDALHVPRVGREVPEDSVGAPPPAKSEPETPTKPTSGRYGTDIDALQRVVEKGWASRARHEELDGVDVAKVFESLRTQVKRSTTRTELARAVRTALCRLGDGHLRLLETSRDVRTLDSGVRVEPVGDAFVITQVDARYDRAAVKPKPGDTVLSADGVPIGQLRARECLRPGSTPAQREYLAAASLGRQQRGTDEAARPEKLKLRRSRGRVVTMKLEWATVSGDTPPTCVRGRKLEHGVGRIDIDSFACEDLATFEAQLNDAVGAIEGARDVVIDLRRNGGGDDAQAKAAARRFVSQSTTWMRFRHHSPTDEAPAAEGFTDEPFAPDAKARIGASRLWVLTGPGCFSTCEIFASVLATQPGVMLIGRPTAGGVGNPEPWVMPRAELTVIVPHTVYALPGTETPIEGFGVPVHVEVRATIDDVERGRDAVLEAALDRIEAAK